MTAPQTPAPAAIFRLFDALCAWRCRGARAGSGRTDPGCGRAGRRLRAWRGPARAAGHRGTGM